MVVPGAALGIEPLGQGVQFIVHMPGHGIRPKWFFMVSLNSSVVIPYSFEIHASQKIAL
jgi:hypothetical protein